ncbi:hypothetical protein ARALYDRAFT_907464 [Arabidopsis lyrata subsp. lyrata]|uniref:Jacalin-type lectin domain-containing protein n=1 Tax=Arabidopsis lyrata subsp. lyrata TaxID=81972 RepID=D7LWE9_ARALL|nr:hypothetical protein ARALYDRAFT_907464 [Arabidopsis lyrata subsp. lyrata]
MQLARSTSVGIRGKNTHFDSNNSLDSDPFIMIAGGDYIEAVEGTYTESHITSITFRMYKGGMMPQYGRLNGMPFSLRGERGEKVIGFYGRSSDVHLTALGVHFSAPPLAFSFRNKSPIFKY